MQKNISQTSPKNKSQEDALFEAQEKRRMIEAILMPDKEKFHLFMKMMKIGKMLKNATVTHKKIVD